MVTVPAGCGGGIHTTVCEFITLAGIDLPPIMHTASLLLPFSQAVDDVKKDNEFPVIAIFPPFC
jgi:hypothetical protein